MNIILINPKGSNFYAKMGATIPPLGLAYIAAVLRQNGHYIKLIDLGVEKGMPSQDYLKFFDVVGISADTPSYPEALSIARVAKSIDKTVIMGGYHVTFLDKEALNTGLVDFIVRGEAEEIILNLITTLSNKGDLLQVQGISFMNHGVYQKNPDAAPPRDLDKMPFPARDLLNMEAYKNKMNGMPFTNLITSRGCPFNCYFCSSSKFGGLKWRARSAKSIVDEIEQLYHTYGFKAFSFMDDNFTFKPKRIFEFADELERRGLNDIYWWCFSRVDILVKNEAMVKRMAEVGAYMVFLGLESNNETLLETYNKHIGNNQQQQAIELLRKYGIKIHGSYIMGDIKETIPMVNQTINWARSVNAKTTQFSILTPYPGTALYNDIEKENRFLHKDWELYDALHPVIKLDNISPKQLGKLLIRAYQKVYLNPARILGRATKKNSNENQKASKNKLSFIEKLKTVVIAFTFMFTLRQQAVKNHGNNYAQ
ncbi:B12-binding domain-containing radical SAM protein [Prolixibacter sp. SD074]|uniref:B12-binding domain-containing radical SAM protein n=1 Tax=Prolixibacter sp. SD074 TaxID=2652391 RepID=UPI001271DF2C|nr:radical SAM protein [Prolixibacter sp. SD074]GET27864.1 B12-binding domain-containing radical SAM protein [Prolixibacter sp. SD074]